MSDRERVGGEVGEQVWVGGEEGAGDECGEEEEEEEKGEEVEVGGVGEEGEEGEEGWGGGEMHCLVVVVVMGDG